MIRAHYGAWVDGKEVEAVSGRKFEVKEPATGKLVATVTEGDAADVARAYESAKQAFEDGRWVNISPRDKCRIMMKAAQLLRDRLEYIIEIEVRSTGRAIKEMRAQIPRVAEWLEYFGSLVAVCFSVTASLLFYIYSGRFFRQQLTHKSQLTGRPLIPFELLAVIATIS